eukprot:scaffold185102_cov17-Tisochrysis_lutea.AAC.1
MRAAKKAAVMWMTWMRMRRTPSWTTRKREESSSDKDNMEEDEADVFLDSQEAVVRMEFWQVGFFDRAMCRLCCTPRCGVLVRSVSKERLYLRARRLLFLLPCEIGSRAVSSSHRARGLLSGGHSGQTRVAVNESVKVSVLPHCSTQHCVVTA